jgi:hypothetical protein
LLIICLKKTLRHDSLQIDVVIVASVGTAKILPQIRFATGAVITLITVEVTPIDAIPLGI